MLFDYYTYEEKKRLFIRRLEKSVEVRHDSPKLKIQQIAADLYMCERQLSRFTKLFLQMTPVDYLRKYRLMKARRLLRQGASAKQATYSVGFSSYSYFARCFKQEYGCTTKQWRSNV